MNRINNFFGRPPCKCCREKKRRAQLKRECERVEVLAGGAIEFLLPAVGTKRQPLLTLRTEFERAAKGQDLREYARSELKRLSMELAAAAERLEVQP